MQPQEPTDVPDPDYGARIRIDGRWRLPEFAVLTERYTQLYSFLYHLRDREGLAGEQRARETFAAFPWHSGFSSLNFFSGLYGAVPRGDRLTIKEIRYASPGFIDLFQDPALVASMSATIFALGSAMTRAAKVYEDIQGVLAKQKLANIDVRRAQLVLEKEQLDFVLDANKRMASELQLSGALVHELERRTNNNPLLKLKILLAVYRRAAPLGELAEQGKVQEIEDLLGKR